MEDLETNTDEVLIRQSLKDLVDNMQARDTNRVMAHYADNVQTFDLAPPSRNVGADTIRQNFQAWIDTFDGPLTYELEQLKVFAGKETAFAYGLSHVQGKKKTGEETDMWVRSTYGFEKRDSKWLIVHEHGSTPFDMQTFKPIFELQG